MKLQVMKNGHDHPGVSFKAWADRDRRETPCVASEDLVGSSVAGRLSAARPFTGHPLASPIDQPRDPPFGGSHEGRDCTTCMRERTRRRLSVSELN
jgi:hypothetical protein